MSVKDRVRVVMRELERISSTYMVPVEELTEWLRRHGVTTYGSTTDEDLRRLEEELRARVTGAPEEHAIVPVTPPPVKRDDEELRKLLKDVIMRGASDAQIELAVAICRKYDLDPLLHHVAFINGGLYVTRDGLLHIAHKSGKLDGIEVDAVRDEEGKWIATARVYRKDMSRPFVYTAYQPEHEVPSSRAWQKSPRAMTVKCAEVMALRRAFAIALTGAEEVGIGDEEVV